MRCGVLFSGGKDSFMALLWALQNGFTVSTLIYCYTTYSDSYLLQKDGAQLIPLLAQSLGFPVETIIIEDEKYELETLQKGFRRIKESYGISHIITGALLSDYQRQRFNRATYDILKVLSPFWRINPYVYFDMIMESNADVRVIRVASDGFQRGDVMCSLAEMNEKLHLFSEKGFMHIAGEGGEYETLVCDSFLHSFPLKFNYKIISESDYVHYIDAITLPGDKLNQTC